MFRDDSQISQACKVLLNTIRKGELWESRPTEEAIRLYRANGGYLSSGERAMLFAAFAIWNADNDKAKLGVLVNRLDLDKQRALWSLLLAQATENDNGATIDAWIAKYSR